MKNHNFLYLPKVKVKVLKEAIEIIKTCNPKDKRPYICWTLYETIKYHYKIGLPVEEIQKIFKMDYYKAIESFNANEGGDSYCSSWWDWDNIYDRVEYLEYLIKINS